MAPCEWDEIDPACCDWSSFAPEVRQSALHVANLIMWAGTGRQFGRCSVTARPCRRPQPSSEYQTYPVSYAAVGQGPYIEDGVWHNLPLGADGRCCSCLPDGRCAVLITGPTTTDAITAVVVDDVLLDPATYVVVDGDTLVRVDGEHWPTCSALASTSMAFEVEYRVGLPIPPSVIVARDLLACELAKECAGAECSLPLRLRTLTRQGVELQVSDLPDDPWLVRTGIRVVDLVLQSHNPRGLSQPPRVLSPDLPAPRRVV